jgi:hypothetical protein
MIDRLRVGNVHGKVAPGAEHCQKPHKLMLNVGIMGELGSFITVFVGTIIDMESVLGVGGACLAKGAVGVAQVLMGVG